jgi:hypothetical protein
LSFETGPSGALHHPYIIIVLRIAAYDVFPPRLQEHDLHNVIGAASVHELHASLLRAYTVVQLQRLDLEELEYISSIRDQHTW